MYDILTACEIPRVRIQPQGASVGEIISSWILGSTSPWCFRPDFGTAASCRVLMPLNAGREWREHQPQVDVLAERPLSQQIAARSGVEHKYPQVIIFRRGTPIWNASHKNITADALARNLPAF